MSRRPAGSSRRPPAGSRISPTSSPTTTRPRWSSPRRRGRPSRRPSLEAPALRFLGLAGERALGLDTAAALGELRAGARAAPDRASRAGRGAGPLRRGHLPCRTLNEAAAALEEAITSFRARGAARRSGVPRWSSAKCSFASAIRAGGTARGGGGTARAAAHRALSCRGADRARSRRDSQVESDDGVRHAEQALRWPRELGCPGPHGHRLPRRRRCELGDAAGLSDFREAPLATDAGQGREPA